MLRVAAAAACVIGAAAHGSWPEDFLFIESSAPAGGPEQLWLALGSDPKSVVVSWLTATADASTVKYGTNGALSLTATGSSTTYSTLGYTSGFIHNATLPALEVMVASVMVTTGGAAGTTTTGATMVSLKLRVSAGSVLVAGTTTVAVGVPVRAPVLSTFMMKLPLKALAAVLPRVTFPERAPRVVTVMSKRPPRLPFSD